MPMILLTTVEDSPLLLNTDSMICAMLSVDKLYTIIVFNGGTVDVKEPPTEILDRMGACNKPEQDENVKLQREKVVAEAWKQK